MKHAKLLSIFFLLFLVTTGLQAFATKVYVPASNKGKTADKVYCLGASTTLMRTRYFTCHTGTTNPKVGTPLTVNWYRNTVNSTTGGTLVSTSSVNCSKTGSGNVSYAPSTATPGVFYYYTVITWSGAGTCNTSGSLTSNTIMITVSDAPDAIAGSSIVCTGSTATYTNSAAGGTWVSSNTGKATIGLTTGELTAISAGTTTLSYRVACGTRVTKIVTVSATPTVNAITGGTANICTGASTALGNTTTGGVWSSGSTSIATVNASGSVTGVATGIATISYTVTNSCGTIHAIKDVTVTTTPAAISGSSTTCASYSLTYSNAVPYGTWTSGSPSKATIDASTGEIDAIAAGTSRITYSTGCGAQVTQVLTVNAGPLPITGTTRICSGDVTTLSNATGGGTWQSTNGSVATIDIASGLLTGVAMGTSRISYANGSACASVTTVTVSIAPPAISGALAICTGTTTTFTNTVPFGTWTSSNAAVATVNASTGLITGVTQGTSGITYNTGCGSVATKVISVNAQPTAITGTASVCQGSTTTLGNSVSGGVWSSQNSSVASVNSSTGVVTGVSGGEVDITYTNGGCYSVLEASVNPLPDPGTIDGDLSICDEDETDLSSDGDDGGTWTSSTSSVASVNATGTVTANSAGTANITYSVTNSCGTLRSVVTVTVNPDPNAGTITGTATLCQSATTTLSSGASGGVWSSSNAAVATVGTGGIVSGVSGGNAIITYDVTTSCGTDIDTRTVTVNPLPSAGSITGTAVVCESATTTLSNAVGGGAWSSSTTSVATITSGGVVSGVTSGTTTISYANSNSCGTVYATQIVTVNPLPSAGSITGTAVVCESATTTLNNAASGGAWSSSNASVATVNASGVVSGVAEGNATISYTVTNSCGTAYATQVATVNPLPSAGTITGTAVVCASATTTLNNATSGGAWSSSDASVATVDASGVVGGVAAGNATISYAVTNSCGTAYATQVATVNPLPSAGAITGTAVVCESATTNLDNATSGGAWSSSDASVATVDASGVVSGVAAGNATISYTVTNSCGTANATQVATVNALPSAGAITGTAVVCESATTNLDNATSGGAWSSSDASVATVDASGVVSGVAAGNATISYTVTNSCGTANATQVATVNPLPSAGAITGTAVVCESATTNLDNATSGGAWSSSDASVATVDASGVVSGVATGNATISYTVTNSCGTANATQVATVNALPSAGSITGTAVVCELLTTTMNNAISGGAWSSSDPSVASVNVIGVVTGVAAGNATISYAVTSICGIAYATQEVTVSPVPSAGSITGTAIVCESATTTLNNATSGGAWSSSDASVATVDASGVVSGVASGNATISYAVTNSCGTAYATQVATVNPLPTAGTITGTAVVCASATTTLNNATSGGAWSSSDASVATVDASGVVSGVAAGNATISYTVTNSCGTANATQVATVNPLPSAGAITGTAVVCESATTNLDNATSGGAWSSSDASVATVDASGVVSGVAAGNATISYAVTNSCGTAYATQVATVNALPSAGSITGTAVVCESATTTLNNATSGGAWSSSDASVATVDASGVVTGVAAGNATISYTVTNSCGTAYATQVATVNVGPSAGTITGATTVCPSATTTLSNATSGGAWSSSDASVATVDASGVVSGVAVGNATVTYTVTNACGTGYTTQGMTVGTAPSAGTITGTAVVCISATTDLDNATTGGVWSSSDASIATVDADGVVTGIGSGNVTISYTVTNGCGASSATFDVAVGISPASISGTDNICLGGTTTLTIADAGGTWISSNTARAVVDATSGVVTSVSVGTATISYMSASGCYYATKEVTVNSSIPDITGASHVCSTQSIILGNSATGGTWTSGNDTLATVNATTGEVTGMSAGTVTISYSVAGGCFTTASVLVYANPVPITGVETLCTGNYTVLYSTIGGSGTWTSTDTLVANPHPTSGMINGIAAGTATITYKVEASGCYVTKDVTVNVTPHAITGTSPICVGTTHTFINTTSGGTWSSSQPSVATVNSGGAVTGVTAGGSMVSYIMPTGCYSIYNTTVNPLPQSITTASDNICLGIGTTFYSATSGGTWSSGNTSIATVNIFTGVATSANLGTATISYRGPNGCYTSRDLSIYSGVTAITGNDIVCKGYTTLMSNVTTGGTWFTSAASVAAISSTSGMLTGMNTGTARISYRLTGGCLALKVVSVAAITGNLKVCIGLSTQLSHLVSGGTWSCSNPSTATVDASTGIVIGVAPGSAIITYNVGSGIFNTAVIIVNPLPAVISGVSSICKESSAVYTGTVGGSATWSSSDVSVATIYVTSGMAYGVSEGTATLTYKIAASGCYRTREITVVPAPESITGSSTLCVGSTTTMESATSGGTWTCTTNGVGTIAATTGCITGGTAGGTMVSYTLTNGCRKTMPLTVTSIPATITGPGTVCEGVTSTFYCPTTGGSWSSSNTSVALPATTSGFGGSTTTSLISGVASGIATISYTGINGCARTIDVAVVAAKPGAPIASATEGNVEFSVYPNPTTGSFTIQTPVSGVFAVYTIDGKMVQQYTVSGTTTVSLPAGLAAGVYMCQFSMEGGAMYSTRLIYQN